MEVLLEYNDHEKLSSGWRHYILLPDPQAQQIPSILSSQYMRSAYFRQISESIHLTKAWRTVIAQRENLVIVSAVG